jgi:hypothetical protein
MEGLIGLGAMVLSKRLRKFVGLGSLILIVAGVTLWYLAPTLGPLSVLFGAAGLIYWAMASVLARIAGVVAEDVKQDYLDEPAQLSADPSPDEMHPLTGTGSSDERRDYELAERVGTREAWESFLTVHGTGFFADLARSQLRKLGNAEPSTH